MQVPKSVLRAVLGRMRSALHATRRTPHSSSRLGQIKFAWLVNTLSAPSRYSRDARVHGHTTTGRPKLSTPPDACWQMMKFSPRTVVVAYGKVITKLLHGVSPFLSVEVGLLVNRSARPFFSIGNQLLGGAPYGCTSTSV